MYTDSVPNFTPEKFKTYTVKDEDINEKGQ